MLGMLAAVLIVGVAAYVADLLPFGAAPEATPEPSASEVSGTPLPAGVQTFKSEALGISFEYLAVQGEPVIEEGDTVYVGGKDGQWVKVFAKKTDESFEQSIRRQVLEKYPSALCNIEVAPSNTLSGYQIAEISYSQSSDGPEPWFENSKLCNPDYAQTNGIRYFLYNPEYPEKFFFFSIGQYAILAQPDVSGGGERTWQDTFRVFSGKAPVSATQPTTSSAQTGTESWKTYSHPDYGYEIKYPGGWTYEDYRRPGVQDLYKSVEFYPPNAQPETGYLSIVGESRTVAKVREVFADQSLGPLWTERVTTFAGFPAYEFTRTDGPNFRAVLVDGPQRLLIGINEDFPEIEKALLSFRFTQ